MICRAASPIAPRLARRPCDRPQPGHGWAWRLALACLVGLAALWPARVAAHDPSAWGGLYRSRDHGATWFLANPGRFVTAAIAVAVSPTDPNHLLLATDSGLLRSRNGGRDWLAEAPTSLLGAVFAVAFDADGQRAMAATTAAIYRTDDGLTWRAAPAPAAAAPARRLATGAAPGQVYLAGWQGLFRSDDWGGTWSSVAEGLPDGPLTALVVTARPAASLWAVVGGEPWRSADGGRAWERRDNGLPGGRVNVVVADRHRADHLWAAAADRLFRSQDGGATWRPVGAPLPDAETQIRGLAADPAGEALTLTTHRGLYRSVDGGSAWELMTDNVPVHLEALPLTPDPAEPATLYAGFSVTPYDTLWQRAARGVNPLDRLDPVNLAGGAAFLLLLALAAGWTLRRLARHYRPGDGPAAPPAPDEAPLALERTTP